jgi:hypothetical protein
LKDLSALLLMAITSPVGFELSEGGFTLAFLNDGSEEDFCAVNVTETKNVAISKMAGEENNFFIFFVFYFLLV